MSALRSAVEALDGAAFFDLDRVAWEDYGPRSRSALVSMTPTAFLFLAQPFDGAPGEGVPPFVPEKMDRVLSAFEQEIPLSDLPYLTLDAASGSGRAKVTGHEGRHRALALRSLGVERMPVVLRSRDYRWGQPAGGFNGREPIKLVQEDAWAWVRRGDDRWGQERVSREGSRPTPTPLGFST